MLANPNCFCPYSGNNKMCSQDVAYYSLGSSVDGLSELHTTVQREHNYDVFCIQSLNRKSSLTVCLGLHIYIWATVTIYIRILLHFVLRKYELIQLQDFR